jgi:hypothetical protein
MKTGHLALLAILLAALVAYGQDQQECKADDSYSVAELKRSVLRVTTAHVHTGFDEKAFNKSGDLASIAIVQTIPDEEITVPETLKEVLSILREAFACPYRCVTAPIDREPKITALLLEHLRNKTQGKLRWEIDETEKFILHQSVN